MNSFARLVERVKQLKTGPGTDTRSYLGPLISARPRDKALRYIEEAQ